MKSYKFKNGRCTADGSFIACADTTTDVPVVGSDGEITWKRAWRGYVETRDLYVETGDVYVEGPNSSRTLETFDLLRFNEWDKKFYQVPSWNPW